MASLEELNSKIASGTVLTSSEEAEYFSLIDAAIQAMKEREPGKYLSFLRDVAGIVEDLNKELDEIRA